MMMMLAASAMTMAAPQAAPGEAEMAWSLAYSGYVARFCPGWRQRPEALPADFLPTAATWNTVWAEGSTRQRAFRAGGLAAEAASKADARFCTHPIEAHAEHRNMLKRVLMPINGATGGK